MDVKSFVEAVFAVAGVIAIGHRLLALVSGVLTQQHQLSAITKDIVQSAREGYQHERERRLTDAEFHRQVFDDLTTRLDAIGRELSLKSSALKDRESVAQYLIELLQRTQVNVDAHIRVAASSLYSKTMEAVNASFVPVLEVRPEKSEGTPCREECPVAVSLVPLASAHLVVDGGPDRGPAFVSKTAIDGITSLYAIAVEHLLHACMIANVPATLVEAASVLTSQDQKAVNQRAIELLSARVKSWVQLFVAPTSRASKSEPERQSEVKV